LISPTSTSQKGTSNRETKFHRSDRKIWNFLIPELSDKAFRKNWAQMIQKICEVEPILCPRCFSEMRVISVIEDPDVSKQILKHLGLWDVMRKLQKLLGRIKKTLQAPEDNVCSIVILFICQVNIFCDII